MTSEFKKIASETNKGGYQSSSLLLFTIVCLISVILYWAAVTELDKVIRGDGKTVSDLENQLIQTSESGVLIKRYFEEGDFVRYDKETDSFLQKGDSGFSGSKNKKK